MWMREAKIKKTKKQRFPSDTHRLHVEDGSLGDDHWPVSGVTFQLSFGPFYRQFPWRIMRSLRHRSQPVVPHKFTKVLRENGNAEVKSCVTFQRGCSELNARWFCSPSLGRRSPRWWRAGPPRWSGCCWGHAGRSRLRGCWACGWWP